MNGNGGNIHPRHNSADSPSQAQKRGLLTGLVVGLIGGGILGGIIGAAMDNDDRRTPSQVGNNPDPGNRTFGTPENRPRDMDTRTGTDNQAPALRP